MSRSLLLAAAALAVASPIAVAAQPAEHSPASFQRDGVTYTYVAEQRGKHRVLSGTANGRPFRLIVRKQKISGVYDNRLVYFRLRDTRDATVGDRFAAR